MAGQDNNQNTPNSQDSGSGGEKLIFGKYKTMEEAERGHKELEKGFHEKSDLVKKFDERFDAIEQRLTPQQDDGYGRGYATAPRETPSAAPASGESTLTRFYQNPDQVLGEVEERATRRLRNEQDRVNANNRLVNDWLGKNQDMAAYPELLTYWVGQQDQRLSAPRKLDEAAKAVRSRIAEIKGTRETPEPKPGDVIEGPGSMRAGAPTAAPAPTGESQLGGYLASRNSQARKPLGQRKA